MVSQLSVSRMLSAEDVTTETAIQMADAFRLPTAMMRRSCLLFLFLTFSRACAWNLRLLRPAAPGTNPWGGSPDMEAVIALRTTVGGANALQAKWLAREQGYFQQLLAVESGSSAEEAIGTAHLGRLAVGGYLVLRADFLLSSVLVDDAHRRQGVGRALVDELRRRVPRTLPSTLEEIEGACWAVVQADDAAATRFCEAIGGSNRGGLADVLAENKLVGAALALSGGAAAGGVRVYRFGGLCEDSPEYRNDGSLSRPPAAALSASVRHPPTAMAPRWAHMAARVPAHPLCKLLPEEDEQAAAATAKEVKLINYQVAATVLRVNSPGFSGGSTYQIAFLVQWLVRAMQPSTAARVDAATMKEACELVERVGTDNQREIARVCGQLEGLKRLAESTTAVDETGRGREDAERQFAEEQIALQDLFRSERKFEQIFI